MKRIFRLYCLRIKSFFMSVFLTRKKQKNVAILVSRKWKNKVSDDLLIKNELLRNHINAKLVDWERNQDYSKYDLVFIRSIWGYEEDIKKFEKFLSKLSKEKVEVQNSISIMKNNYDKEIQFALLDKYEVPHIKTTFVKENCNDIEKFIQDNIKENEFVIKPKISASGNNTNLVTDIKKSINTISLKEVNDKYKVINKNTSLMIQPFIKEIEDGEISLIYINGSFTHAVLRFPGVLNKKSSVTYIDRANLDPQVFEVADKVLNIKEYKNNLYERIDIVKIDNKYFVMEIELVEPDLFIRQIKEEQLKKYIVTKIALAVKEKL